MKSNEIETRLTKVINKLERHLSQERANPSNPLFIDYLTSQGYMNRENMEIFMNMNNQQRDNFFISSRSAMLIDMMSNHIVTLEQLISLSIDQLCMLDRIYTKISGFLRNGIITLEQAFQLNMDHVLYLSNQNYYDFITYNVYNLNVTNLMKFLNGSIFYSVTSIINSIGMKGIINLLDNKIIIQDDLLEPFSYPVYFLENQEIVNLMNSGKLKRDHILQLYKLDKDDVLRMPETITHLISGDLTAEKLILEMKQMKEQNTAQRAEEAEMEQQFELEMAHEYEETEEAEEAEMEQQFELEMAHEYEEENHTIIDYAQKQLYHYSYSHHYLEHQLVSDSANTLMSTYGSFIDNPEKLKSVILNLKAKVFELPDNSIKNVAAKICMSKIIEDVYVFTDPNSKVTLKELLALVFLAISDESKLRQSTFDDAMNILITGLYEIRDKYAFYVYYIGEDKLEVEDRPGLVIKPLFNLIFNLLKNLEFVQIVVGRHYVTNTIININFNKILPEEAMNYLSRLAAPDTQIGFLAFINLIAKIKENGINEIYHNIKNIIEKRMLAKFENTYFNNIVDNFVPLIIDSDKYYNLDNYLLSQLQQKTQNSLGYQKYCSAILKRSTGNLLFSFNSFQATDANLEVEKICSIDNFDTPQISGKILKCSAGFPKTGIF